MGQAHAHPHPHISYGLYGYGLYSYGLYSHGLCQEVALRALAGLRPQLSDRDDLASGVLVQRTPDPASGLIRLTVLHSLTFSIDE